MAQFRAKARAVDLLGKGQIADLPTAISELWKNGYDAYASDLRADLYMPDYENYGSPVFVMSDDGVGMNYDEINSKWFVLGTDSKTRGEKDVKGPKTLFKEPRIKMGEKGIGRLAVAYLGPQMLMLTKKQEDVLYAIYFDWRILENYNLFLEDIIIPIKQIDHTEDVNEVFEVLRNEFLDNFRRVKNLVPNPWKDQMNEAKIIIEETKKLKLPSYITEDYIQDLLADPLKSSGTKFVVFEPVDQILDLKNYVKSDSDKTNETTNAAEYTISSLAGLFNLFKYANEDSICDISFNINEVTGIYDLLTYNAFFEPTDFEECDHLIDGEFDGEGNFKGDVRIYRETVHHEFSSLRTDRDSGYGAFKLKLGVIPGPQDTSLTDERFRYFKSKLDLFGGLYVYRDDFRILPYGRSDYDFLQFEERRGKRAGHYFFAKRRMFGYIEITRENNKKLREKSSREGFINNAAYREFRTLLIEFFIDLAKKYFATDAEYDYKDKQVQQLRKLAASEKDEKRREKEAKRKFARKLKEYPKEIEELEENYLKLVDVLKHKVSQVNVAYEDIDETIRAISECKDKLAKLKIVKPVRFKPSDNQRGRYDKYLKKYQEAEKRISLAEPALKEARLKLDIHERYKEFEARGKYYRNKIMASFNQYQNRIKLASVSIQNNFTVERSSFLEEYEEKYNAIIPEEANENAIENSIGMLTSIFEEINSRAEERINPFIEHIERLTFDINEDHLIGYYKIQYEEMMEEWKKTHELAQLGIAVEIIDHQFNTLYAQLKESIKTLESYIIQDSKSTRRYKTLVTAFDHLEDNYKLLQPLYRTTGRIRKDVTGFELYEYANDFFEKRLKDSNITFEITPEAKKWSVFSFESILKPVIINVINNAIYWLGFVEKRIIRIDTDGVNLFVLNSGKEIENHLIEDIFKMFYSARPNGRGIGLYLAKKSLNGIGIDIYATNSEKLNILGGACFVIAPMIDQIEN
ncbi:MAG: ATP-binding protein [Lewinella sp.]|uniref:ATP-binding protein n=1 Tax=Lewinella sp. TaxID=2004506 RepID=UPI003D6C6513